MMLALILRMQLHLGLKNFQHIWISTSYGFVAFLKKQLKFQEKEMKR